MNPRDLEHASSQPSFPSSSVLAFDTRRPQATSTPKASGNLDTILETCESIQCQVAADQKAQLCTAFISETRWAVLQAWEALWKGSPHQSP